MRTADRTGLKLAVHLTRAVGLIADQLRSADDAQLIALGAEVDQILAVHRTVMSAITRRPRPSRVFGKADAGRILRAVIVFTSVFNLVARDMKTSSGTVWGAHLFSTHDFDGLGFDDFVVPANTDAIRRLLADQAADLSEAVLALVAPVGAYYGATASLAASLDTICKHYKSSSLRPLPIDLWDAAEVASELKVSTADVATMTSRGELLTVPTWSGETRYPRFQFDLGAVNPEISFAVQNVSPKLTGWPLAVWLHANRTESAAFFEKALAERGLWVPEWSATATNHYKNLDGQPTKVIKAKRSIYRVASTGFSPFFFASVAATAPNGGEGGRFDLSEGGVTGKGSVYAAFAPRGAWREVLQRVPVVTLRNLLGRTLWELRPMSGITVATVTGRDLAVATDTNRADTQAVAERLAGAGFDGIEYPLRTGSGEIGLVLFGPAGPTLPEAAGFGAWAAKRHDGVAHQGLWSYLADREAREPDYPVVLRRFPTEIQIP